MEVLTWNYFEKNRDTTVRNYIETLLYQLTLRHYSLSYLYPLAPTRPDYLIQITRETTRNM